MVGSYLFYEGERLKSTTLEIIFLDVGQGDSILIRTPSNSYGLIDAGRGTNILLPLGNYMPNNVRNLEFVILTHPDADHIEGFLQLAKRYTISNLFINKTFKESLLLNEILLLVKEKSIKNFSLYAGNDFKIDSLNFDILWPIGISTLLEENNTNESSIALLLKYRNFELYTAGDLGKSNELASLVGNINIKADVLKVGHHGSSTSSDETFITRLDPEVAVIQVGENNPYGHPTNETLKLIEEKEIKIYRTDKAGSIKISTDGINAKVITEVGTLLSLKV